MFLDWQSNQQEIEDIGVGIGLAYENKLFSYPAQQED